MHFLPGIVAKTMQKLFRMDRFDANKSKATVPQGCMVLHFWMPRWMQWWYLSDDLPAAFFRFLLPRHKCHCTNAQWQQLESCAAKKEQLETLSHNIPDHGIEKTATKLLSLLFEDAMTPSRWSNERVWTMGACPGQWDISIPKLMLIIWNLRLQKWSGLEMNKYSVESCNNEQFLSWYDLTWNQFYTGSTTWEFQFWLIPTNLSESICHDRCCRTASSWKRQNDSKDFENASMLYLHIPKSLNFHVFRVKNIVCQR